LDGGRTEVYVLDGTVRSSLASPELGRCNEQGLGGN